ncbi:ubiquitin carboxyl-terminal hydrolase 1 isoform X2 [Engraulis encrasicolus]|uniref:ubiquitin carboxyl-terminal hydrolase 1 isoform X2 n=1 Tax=Engraulis encrasicolus TaxID=184585 RepID=UPI002FD1D2BB
MPGLQADAVVAALGSPIKKSKLSLKFFQKKDTKRALDFSETQAEEQNAQPLETEETASLDQVVPCPCPSSPVTCERREVLVPFVGLNNLGNTCYLNSILQVLYYCPGFKEAIKKLYKLSKGQNKQKKVLKDEEQEGSAVEAGEGEQELQAPAQVELLASFHSLITSLEQLQSNFLVSPSKYGEGELATPPRKLLNSLRQLNPMYEGYLQHDAQEVLQCILGYIQEACDIIRKEEPETTSGKEETKEEDGEGGAGGGADGQLSGKRKSDTEAGNAKKKPKSQGKNHNTTSQEEEELQQPATRSKRKSSGDISTEGAGDQLANGHQEAGQTEEEEEKVEKEKEEGSEVEEAKLPELPKETTSKRKKRARLSWLKSSSSSSSSSSTSSGKQPSIFSKFRSMGRLTSHLGGRSETKEEQEKEEARRPQDQDQTDDTALTLAQTSAQCKDGKPQSEETQSLDVLKSLFQGQLVLRTRCLECECFTERREDFQDISVPVQEDEQTPRDSGSEISPEPKPELKTLKWAISQFASVERIVGEDKYFCETCRHYTEAERSLLFDKTPSVITIHLKCFAANSSELDPYAGLSKVNTPLQTPLQLSLEEWSTGAAPPGGQQQQHYQLFAVVMHSGVTISSGHYTTYVRMSDLQKLSLSREEGEDESEVMTQAAKKVETSTQEYDDGEVSFSLSGRVGGGGGGVGGCCVSSASAASPSAKPGTKKSLEGVGLLGGQRSLATYDLAGSSKHQGGTDKSVFPSGSQPLGSAAAAGVKKEKEATAVGERRCVGAGDLQNLLDYEGKWLLFDDSEVRLYEEEEFLRACSPDTCSTSTPYLLFYRRVPQHK